MDDYSRINAYKDGLRIVYKNDAVGLRRIIAELMDPKNGAAADSVVINSMSFEGEQATGIVTLEPLAKLRAAIDVLREIDPTAPEAPATMRYADFGCSPASF